MLTCSELHKGGRSGSQTRVLGEERHGFRHHLQERHPVLHRLQSTPQRSLPPAPPPQQPPPTAAVPPAPTLRHRLHHHRHRQHGRLQAIPPPRSLYPHPLHLQQQQHLPATRPDRLLRGQHQRQPPPQAGALHPAAPGPGIATDLQPTAGAAAGSPLPAAGAHLHCHSCQHHPHGRRAHYGACTEPGRVSGLTAAGGGDATPTTEAAECCCFTLCCLFFKGTFPVLLSREIAVDEVKFTLYGRTFRHGLFSILRCFIFCMHCIHSKLCVDVFSYICPASTFLFFKTFSI